jgi:hypothetical protein
MIELVHLHQSHAGAAADLFVTGFTATATGLAPTSTDAVKEKKSPGLTLTVVWQLLVT